MCGEVSSVNWGFYGKPFGKFWSPWGKGFGKFGKWPWWGI